MEMEIQAAAQFMPLETAVKYYRRWDCDIVCKNEEGLYYKCLNGEGSVEFLNGNSYTGTFRNGLMHGKGSYRWKGGLVYEGQFQDNAPSGEGILSWPDGSKYTGTVHEGKRHGQGEYYCSLDGSTYRGSWNQGLKHGHGSLNFANGSVYEGDFVSGLREGKGRMRYPSNNEYEGDWRKDKKEGKGTMNWTTAGEKYEGTWKGDQLSGEGSYYWYEQRPEGRIVKTIFRGQWKTGKREGFGVFFYSSGCRLEGTFVANQKQGLCYLLDEFGQGKMELFKGDKSVARRQELAGRQNRTLRLPQITGKIPTLTNNQAGQNCYSKFVDIQSPLLDESILNLLLRQNSQLRTWYRILAGGSTRESFHGLTLEELWRMVKDLRLTDHAMSLARLDREFQKGWKAHFSVELPSKQKLELARQNQSLLTSLNYHELQWHVYFKQALQIPLDWKAWSNLTCQPVENVGLSAPTDLHNRSQVVLFRHFVMYLVQLALQIHRQGKGSSFRKCLQELLVQVRAVLSPGCQTKTEKICSQVITNVSNHLARPHISEQCSAFNKQVFLGMSAAQDQMLGKVDRTVTVKQVYSLLGACGLLREASEKMLFLEKIERNMNAKGSLLRKENKGIFPQLEKIVLISPHFSHLSNYEMLQAEFDEILYLLLNRKIGSTQSKEEFNKKYAQITKNMIDSLPKPASTPLLPLRSRLSQKDQLKLQLQQRIKAQKQLQQEEQRKIREQRRQDRERTLMKREDCDVKDEEESEQSEEYYD